MELNQHTVNEFKVRVFDESIPRIERCLKTVSNNEIWGAPNENITSIGCQILHLIGNARQWVNSGVGEQYDDRDRDWEFIAHPEIDKGELIQKLSDLKISLNKTLDAISNDDLNKITSVQGFEVSGFSILVHVIEHFSYHTGQISVLTKIMRNEDLGYYSDFNLND